MDSSMPGGALLCPETKILREGNVNMMDETTIKQLNEAEQMAYFRADICLASPESYTLEEKRQICEDMVSTFKAIENAMCADFEQMPPELRSRLLAILCEADAENAQCLGRSRRRRESHLQRVVNDEVMFIAHRFLDECLWAIFLCSAFGFMIQYPHN